MTGLYRFLALIGLIILQLTSLPAAGTDVDSVDADVEETMLESDATTVQAKLEKERQARLRKENSKLKTDAATAKNRAMARQQEAAVRLKAADKAVQLELAEQRIHKKNLKMAEEKIKKAEAQMALARRKVSKAKTDSETVKQLKEDRQAKLVKIQAETTRLQQEQADLNKEVEQTRQEFEKLKSQANQADTKLNQSKKDAMTRKSQLREKLEKLKAAQKHSAERASVVEAEMGQLKKDIRQLEEDVKDAQEKKDQTDYRLQSNREQLALLRAKAKRLGAGVYVTDSNRSDEAKEALAMMGQAQDYQLRLGRAPKHDPGNAVKVALIPTSEVHRDPSSSQKVLVHDCQVFDKPDPSGRVLGVKRAGSAVVPGQKTEDWVSVTISNRKAYVPINCFASNNF